MADKPTTDKSQSGAGVIKGRRTPPGNKQPGNRATGKQTSGRPPKGKKRTREDVQKRGLVAAAVYAGTTAVNAVLNTVSVSRAQFNDIDPERDLRESISAFLGLTTPLNNSLNQVVGIKAEEIVKRFYEVASGMLKSTIEAAVKSKNSTERELGFLFKDVGDTITSYFRIALGLQPVVPKLEIPFLSAKKAQASR